MPKRSTTTPTRQTIAPVGTQAGTHPWSPFYRGRASAASRAHQSGNKNSLQTAGFDPRQAEIAMPP